MNAFIQKKKSLILKGIAHPVRMAIVESLSAGEMCVCDIAENFSFDRTTISKHLALLRELEILECRRDGLNIYYSLRMKCLPSLLNCIEQVVRGENPNACVLTGGCADTNTQEV